jgi:hypothetical protein
MNYLLIGLVWLLNFGISIWNAYAVGKSWAEARAAGGWPRIMCWSGAVMSASGFSWCYLLLLGLIGYKLEWIDPTQLGVAFNLGYILLIPGILLSGLMITLDSWGRAFRQGGFLNYGVAIYNTYAQIHNTYSAITSLGAAVRSVRQYFGQERSAGRNRDDRNGWIVVVILVLLALAAGILTTTFIVWRTAGSTALPPRPTQQQFEDSARNVERVRG